MKLRQKLAAVLAATMVVTAIPVVTMGAETSISQNIAVIEGSTVGYAVSNVTTPAGVTATATTEITSAEGTDLRVKFDDSEIGQKTTFYVDSKNAEFNKQAFIAKGLETGAEAATKSYFTAAGDLVAYNDGTTDIAHTTDEAKFTVTRPDGSVATVTYLSKTQVKVDLDLTASNGTLKSIAIPMLIKIKTGIPTLIIDGAGSFVESKTVALTDADVTKKTLSVGFDSSDAVIPVEGHGELGDIIITEAIKGALDSSDVENRTISIKLPNSSDLQFAGTQNITFKGGRGLGGITVGATVTVQDDNKEMIIVFDQTSITNSLGYIEIQGIDVQPEDARKDVAEGDVSVTVKGNALTTTTGVVAQVKNYGISLKVEKVVSLMAGKEAEEVTLLLEETAPNTLNKRHTAYFEVDNANVVPGTVEVVEGSKNAAVTVKEDLDKDGKVEGFIVDFANVKEDEKNKIELKFEVKAELDQAGEVTITADSRSFQEDLKAKIADATAPVAITAEVATVKVGLNGQTGGTVTLKETQAGMIGKGQLVLTFDETGIKFANDDIKIETDSTLDVKVKNVKNGVITLDVNKTSKEPATLKISGFTLNVDRTVAEGTIDLEIGGTSLSDVNTTAEQMEEKFVVESFIKVATKNTEDVSQGTTKAVTAGFKIGSTTYTVNGEEKTMDAAPYASSKSRTMMPVRYVAEAFGIKGNDVMYSNVNGGTVTIFAGNRVVQLVNGSNKAIMNGVTIAMDEAVTMKNGRTYVPVGEVARLLGIQVEWDNTTKTATFKN